MKPLIRKTTFSDSAKSLDLPVMRLRKRLVAGQGQTSLLEGSLEGLSSRVLLTELHQQKWSGKIELRFGERLKRLWMEEGRIGRLQSNLRSELFGHFLQQTKGIQSQAIQEALQIQSQTHPQKRLGEIVTQELRKSSSFPLSDAELKLIERFQFVSSLIQALTWTKGAFTLTPGKSATLKDRSFVEIDVIPAVHELFDFRGRKTVSVFSELPLWNESSGPISLTRTPLWSFLASVRVRELSGVLILRKDNSLYELVIKQGIPVIFYEGTFARPRQCILVRQEGDDHEQFFVDQVFHLMSFSTASAFFRPFEMSPSLSSALEPVESTAVMPEDEMKEDPAGHCSGRRFEALARKVLRLFSWRA